MEMTTEELRDWLTETGRFTPGEISDLVRRAENQARERERAGAAQFGFVTVERRDPEVLHFEFDVSEAVTMLTASGTLYTAEIVAGDTVSGGDDYTLIQGHGVEPIDPRIVAPHPPVMSDVPTRAETDAKIAASEARTETRFADLRGDLRLISHSLAEVRAGQRSGNALVVGSAIGAAALVIATLAFGASWFGLGISAGDVADKAAQKVLQQYVGKPPAPPMITPAPSGSPTSGK